MWLDKRAKFTKEDKYLGRIFCRILDAAASIKKCEEQLRRTTHDLRTQDAKCSEVDGGILECLL